MRTDSNTQLGDIPIYNVVELGNEAPRIIFYDVIRLFLFHSFFLIIINLCDFFINIYLGCQKLASNVDANVVIHCIFIWY